MFWRFIFRFYLGKCVNLGWKRFYIFFCWASQDYHLSDFIFLFLFLNVMYLGHVCGMRLNSNCKWGQVMYANSHECGKIEKFFFFLSTNGHIFYSLLFTECVLVVWIRCVSVLTSLSMCILNTNSSAGMIGISIFTLLLKNAVT